MLGSGQVCYGRQSFYQIWVYRIKEQPPPPRSSTVIHQAIASPLRPGIKMLHLTSRSESAEEESMECRTHLDLDQVTRVRFYVCESLCTFSLIRRPNSRVPSPWGKPHITLKTSHWLTDLKRGDSLSYLCRKIFYQGSNHRYKWDKPCKPNQNNHSLLSYHYLVFQRPSKCYSKRECNIQRIYRENNAQYSWSNAYQGKTTPDKECISRKDNFQLELSLDPCNGDLFPSVLQVERRQIFTK